eukprot:m.10090 g.10090  ORF g.10090 m.10090 type:complete len:895 (+) comp7208_c0_seq1:114-2798(+)
MRILASVLALTVTTLAASPESENMKALHLRRRPPPPPTDPVLDCGARKLLFRRALDMQPWRGHAEIFDALELGVICNETRPSDLSYGRTPHNYSADMNRGPDGPIIVVVDALRGVDSAIGSWDQPIKTVHAALSRTRQLRQQQSTTKDLKGRIPAKIVLRDGVHFLGRNGTIKLSHEDSGLTIESAPGEFAWLSGGIALSDLEWRPYKAENNVWMASLKHITDDLQGVQGLFTIKNQARYSRARFPNADVETAQWGYDSPLRLNYSIDPSNVTAWHRPAPNGDIPTPVFIDLTRADNPTGFVKNNSQMTQYNTYTTGAGGVCDSVWDTTEQSSYWCSNASGGGWAIVDFQAAQTGQLGLPVGMTYDDVERLARLKTWHNATGAVVHAWHSQSWFVNMFEVAEHNPVERTMTFSRGGSQGGRSWCRCDQCAYAGPWCNTDNTKEKDTRLISGGWYVENVFEELDQPGEYFYDATTQTLYLSPNATDATQEGRADVAPTPPTDLVVPVLHQLIRLDGTKAAPVQNVTLSNIGIRDARHVYLEKWSVPSGGDWAIYPSGAVLAVGSEHLLVQDCLFRRLDASAIFLHKYNRHASIHRNEFHLIGDNAIAGWGKTDEWDGRGGDQPRFTSITDNFIHELGYFEKQSSAWFQAKSCQTRLENNILFNLPRAAINFNDGFGGGNAVVANLIFNSCRESGDHGPINTWDREPFVTDVADPAGSFRAVPSVVTKNFIFSNYGASQGIDNDDGSSYYHISDNVFYSADGFKMDYGGHDSKFTNNLIVTLPYDGQNCLNVGGFLPGHGDDFSDNTCFVVGCFSYTCDDVVAHVAQCDPTIVTVTSNTYYSKHGNGSISCGNKVLSLADAQKEFNIEKGSTASVLPKSAVIVQQMEAKIKGWITQ